MFLDTPISSLPATSFITIRRLKSLGINTYFDLLNYFPSRYQDFSLMSKIALLQPGEIVTIQGKIVDSKFIITKTHLKIQVFKVNDGSGEVEIGFYNQPYLLRLLKKDDYYSFSGIVEQFGKKITLRPEAFEPLGDLKHTGKIIPVYPEKMGLSSKIIREKIYYLWHNCEENNIKEFLPEKIKSFNNLISENEAYRQIHYPNSKEKAQQARKRLAFDELFTIQLSSNFVKKEWEEKKVGNPFKVGNAYMRSLQDFINNLPFKLTNDQSRVWDEIRSDLLHTVPMNRFLQGEVGSGKTVVAALACYLAYLNGYQSLFMAPTEILAIQHYQTLKKIFANYPIKIGLQTGSTKISNGDLIVGTHALISKKFKMDKVGLVIVDEQHRFGVAQRTSLKEKGLNPHLLTMTATPIPRTVALTFYGELDLSTIDEMPKNRLPVKSYFVPKVKRTSCYSWIKNQIKTNASQVFIVCPLIDESPVETMKTIKAAKTEFERLKTKVFPEFKLGLLHGKLKSTDKEKVMTDFKNKAYDILVTTPVVEVGVDIENATIMLIEAGERFGLAQLHQLRGRVGRGKKQSYCFVFSEIESPDVASRLQYFSKTANGNTLSEKDLQIRGPGNIYGLKQHGYLDLKIASLSDYEMIKKTNLAAKYFLNHYLLKDYPQLKERLKKYQFEKIAKD